MVDEERPLALGGPRQRALLAILLLHRGEVVSSDRLIDQLWGERAPPTAAKTVQGYVSHLRKALGSGMLVTRGGGYLLAAEPEQVDAGRFATSVAAGRRALDEGDAARARRLLGAALAMWRGEALADLAYEPFAQREIARLEEARSTALEYRIDADLTLGQHRAVIGELGALVATHPNRERLLGQLMLALYRSGRQADALDAYREGSRVLREELGLQPGPELRALEQQILNHDPTLSPKATTAARASGGRRLIAVGGALLVGAAVATGIVALAGGAATRLQAAPNSVAAIDTRSNRVVADVPVGARPGAIAFGSGSLWVANADDESVSRVDPRALRTLRTISVGARPTGIAAAGGRVWLVASPVAAQSISVFRIDPRFDTIERTARIGNVVPAGAAVIAARGERLSVAPFSGPLTRVDSRTGRVREQLDPNAAPAGIALDAAGAWVTDTEAGTATRVDATGLLTPVPVGHAPSGIAVGFGAVWVANRGDDAVVRIDPATHAVTTTIPVGNAPAGLAIGDGSVWVANSGDGTVTRIDPGTGKPIARILVGGSPQRIAVGGGRAWVTVDAPTVPAAGSTARDGTVRLVSEDDVDSMDPALAYNWSWQLLYVTCAKLLNYPDKAGAAGSQLVPEVAQSLPARSADGRTYTFTIRPGFRFSPPSNAPVTAQTFKDSIERTLDPRMHSPAARDFQDIVGARAYRAGRAAHIAGVSASGDTLTIRLVAPAPDLPARSTEPAFCAVPSGTPIAPMGVIPSAGPYRVASYTPGHGVVLTRNPNYHGSRPHQPARIEVTVGTATRRAIAQVEAGDADYAVDGPVDSADAARLAARFGPGSPAARSGHQQYFVNPAAQLDFLALNSHRPLFADVRLRRAVSYAIDRTALARLGDYYWPLPAHPTDQFLPPGFPGYDDAHIYPLTPDVAKARALVGRHAGATVVLYTCDRRPCDQQAQIIRTNLAAVGLRLKVKAFAAQTLGLKVVTPGEPFDMAWGGTLAGYSDPDTFLDYLLESGTAIPTLVDPTTRARLASAARLAGPRRYLAYARLDADITRRVAPLVAFGNLSAYALFSARTGCQLYQPVYGIDLAALCLRKPTTR